MHACWSCYELKKWAIIYRIGRIYRLNISRTFLELCRWYTIRSVLRPSSGQLKGLFQTKYVDWRKDPSENMGSLLFQILSILLRNSTYQFMLWTQEICFYISYEKYSNISLKKKIPEHCRGMEDNLFRTSLKLTFPDNIRWLGRKDPSENIVLYSATVGKSCWLS